MDSDTHLRLLGEATGRSQQLELCTTQMLARALAIPESNARLLTTAMGQHGTFGVLERLATRKECGRLEPKDLRAWLKQAQAANEARNRVMHSPWVTDDEGEGVTFVLTRLSVLEPRAQEDLERDIATLTAAVRGALSLL